jgi:hypothetical protein
VRVGRPCCAWCKSKARSLARSIFTPSRQEGSGNACEVASTVPVGAARPRHLNFSLASLASFSRVRQSTGASQGKRGSLTAAGQSVERPNIKATTYQDHIHPINYIPSQYSASQKHTILVLIPILSKPIAAPPTHPSSSIPTPEGCVGTTEKRVHLGVPASVATKRASHIFPLRSRLIKHAHAHTNPVTILHPASEQIEFSLILS